MTAVGQPVWERPRPFVPLTTIGDVLVRTAARRPDHESLVFVDARETYAQTLERAEAVARSLTALGVRRGETVAVLMPNCPDFVHTLFGCAMIGVRALLVNARYKDHELAYVLGDAGAVAVVTTDLVSEYVDFVPLVDRAAERLPALRLRVLLGSSSPPGYEDRLSFAAAADSVPLDEVIGVRRSIRIRDVGIMIYTSGTTSEPKGCLISHEALVRTGISVSDRFELTEDDRMWDPLPLFHMAGLLQLIAIFHTGATFMTMTHFEPAAAIRQMESEGCTFAYPCFPTITQSILHHPDFDPSLLSRVRAILDTGPPETLREVGARWNGVPVLTSYGLTEGGGVVAFSHLHDAEDERVGTGGRPLRGMEVRIADPETDEELPVGEVGQILVRGPGLFDGYHGDPEKTAEAMRGGWLHTGDLGTVDEDGRVAYRGRSKDMLKVGGENVAALEIEAFLQTHPSVKIAQVVGVPDPKYLEVPAAFVELAPGERTTEDELVAYCKGTIASFKVPRYVRFVDEWPMSATKIQKHRLREQLAAELP